MDNKWQERGFSNLLGLIILIAVFSVLAASFLNVQKNLYQHGATRAQTNLSDY